MTQAALDKALKGPTFHPISTSRKVKNSVAAILFSASFLIAMLPLAWLLYTLLSRGFRAVLTSGWCTKSLAGVLPEQFAGGVYHAIYGTIVQAGIAAVISVPLGVMAAIYQTLLGKMQADGFRVFEKRYRLSMARKLAILSKHLIA